MWMFWRLDLRERLDQVSLGQGLGGQLMARDCRLQRLLEMGEALDVIHVGVRGDDRLAVGKREIELPDQLEDFVGRVLKAHVDENPLRRVEDQIHVAPQPLAGLVIDLDHMGKDGLPRKHEERGS